MVGGMLVSKAKQAGSSKQAARPSKQAAASRQPSRLAITLAKQAGSSFGQASRQQGQANALARVCARGLLGVGGVGDALSSCAVEQGTQVGGGELSREKSNIIKSES